MPEELHLVTELAIIMVAAGVFTIICKALKQPMILGYIVAGFIVGPNLGLFPQFSTESVHQWSELGIIFLLFGLGLEFSFKKLIKIGGSALITSVVTYLGMFVVGSLLGAAMGWTHMESIFLGGLMGMSSTTIIIKAYGDMGLKNKPYANLIFGTLVFEDLLAVLTMVLLSTVAVTGKFSGAEMFMALLKLVFFLILWFLLGMYLLPTFLKKVRKLLDDEIILLFGLGLCFGMVVLANLAGFSSALGAFVMGSLLAETLEGKNIAKVTGSIKDMFGAIFFVSVGMMISPVAIAEHWLPILLITISAIVGILCFSTTGALLAGQGLDTAIHTGFTLAQLGEFGFIIAGMGMSLGVTRDFIYPVIIAVSVITTFTTPYLIRLGDPVSQWLNRILPSKFLEKVNPTQTVHIQTSKAEKSEWSKLLKSYFLRFVMYGVVIIAIITGGQKYLRDLITTISPNFSETVASLICCGITLAVLAPFLFLFLAQGKVFSEQSNLLLKKNPANRWPLLTMIVVRILLVIWFVIYVVGTYFDLKWWGIPLILVVVGLALLFSKSAMRHYGHLEETFLDNLNAREESERRSAPVTTAMRSKMAGYDVHIAEVIISPDFQYIGQPLRQMPFRRTTGVNIIKIVRGSYSIIIPSGDDVIYPGDGLIAVGTDRQLEAFTEIISRNTVRSADINDEEFAVEAVTVTLDSPLVGKTLREIGMRSNGCMAISVLHDDKQIINPNADYGFEEGDIVWIAGEKSAVEWYR